MDKQIKQLSNLELAEFFNQMSLLLRSGISALEGLVLLKEDALSEAEKELLAVMIDEMETSGSFHDAASSVNVFPPYALHMIKLGEETGCLDDITTGLSEHYTREVHFKNMIRNALLYPMIMLGMMVLVILILLTKVMPIFQQVFQQLGQEMTGFSAGLLHAGEMLSRHSILLIVVLLIFILAICFGRKHLPFQKKIQETIAACHFCEGMAIALKSGITPEESLTMAAALVEDAMYLKQIDVCKELLANGQTLSCALQKSKLLTGTYARMISLAEKAGRLEEALAEIASEHEHAVNAKITGLIALLEPTLVIVLSIIVGVILFSVMLPLLGIMTGL